MHPSMFVSDDQHCNISFSDTSGRWPLSGTTRDACGAWASPIGTNIAMQATINSTKNGFDVSFAAMV